MSSSQIEICNLAISEVGGGQPQFISSFNDGTVESATCALWYDRMRRNLLRTAPWGFARFQNSLSQLGDLFPDNTSPYPWLWQYAYPSDCIKFRYVIPPPLPPPGATQVPQTGTPVAGPVWFGPSRNFRFLVQLAKSSSGAQSKTLISNVENAIGVYTADVTNPDVFDDLFIEALQASLSYKLVIPLSGNVAMKNDFKATAELAITQARTADGNEAIPSTDVQVDWIRARGSGSVFGFAPYGGLGGSWGQWYGGYDDMSWGM